MGPKKILQYLVWHTHWKSEGMCRLGKVLERLHARLPVGLGWDWCLEKRRAGRLRKVLGILMGGVA